ncbi:MAG: SAM-dependent chlorinase/fluorinase [Elusimicrobia bacterium]|nr:SAM-dependent chlorinase/fluorinase [Elusimicrobiota bacterium]
MKTKFIALLSDFGIHDPFVGAMKGVILSRAPALTIIDITHHIPPQDIRAAAFYLMTAMPYMPKGTLFIAVVDPTVGTGRGILWAKTANYQFIAPDNGILSWVEEREKIKEARFINKTDLFMPHISSTFHGRDIMAPVAAAIARGLPENHIGPLLNDYRRFPFPRPAKTGNRVAGRIITVDRFGNAITNLTRHYINARSIFTVSDKIIKGLKLTYASVAEGEAMALIGSFGFLEFSIRNGNFAGVFGVKPGDEVEAITSLDE